MTTPQKLFRGWTYLMLFLTAQGTCRLCPLRESKGKGKSEERGERNRCTTAPPKKNEESPLRGMIADVQDAAMEKHHISFSPLHFLGVIHGEFRGKIRKVKCTLLTLHPALCNTFNYNSLRWSLFIASGLTAHPCFEGKKKQQF